MGYLFMTIVVAFLVLGITANEPSAERMELGNFDLMEAPKIVQRRAFLPPRYKGLFGQQSRVRDGFQPSSMSEFTGNFGGSRRQVFSWQPQTHEDVF